MKQSELMDALIAAGQRAPSADNAQMIDFYCSSHTLSARFSTNRFKGQTFGPDAHATLLAVGGILENMLTAADFLGIPISCHIPNEASETYFTLTLPPENKLENLGENWFNQPLFLRHTNRFPYKKVAPPQEVMMAVRKQTEGSAFVTHLEDAVTIKRLIHFIKQASEVRFQTEEVHQLLSHSLRYTEEEVAQGDGINIANLMLPPGGAYTLRFLMNWKWMKRLNSLKAYQLIASAEVQPLKHSASILGIIGGNSRQEILQAGRLMNRAWTYLNEKGLAVQPFYVITDQLQRYKENKVPDHLGAQIENVYQGTNTLFHLQNDHMLHILLRIGYPTKNTVMSARLPIEKVRHFMA